MSRLTELAEKLEGAKLIDDSNEWIATLDEAAAHLRAADGQDVAGLMAMADNYADKEAVCQILCPDTDDEVSKAYLAADKDCNAVRTNLESALRLALAAARQDGINHARDVAVKACEDVRRDNERQAREGDNSGHSDCRADGAAACADAIKEALK